MYYSVRTAECMGGHKLLLHFEDGTSGVVDFSKYIRRGGVFLKLADPTVFQSFTINPDFGVVSWGDVDIAPETLYECAQRGQDDRRISAVAAVAEEPGRYSTRQKKRPNESRR